MSPQHLLARECIEGNGDSMDSSIQGIKQSDMHCGL